MSTRDMISQCIITFALLTATTLASAASSPNFIIIFTDDLGYADLGCYGAKDYDTPAIDQMAKEGRRFTHFYASPTCSASRAALLTGCYPLRAGFDDAIAVKKDGRLSPSRVLWPGSPLGLNPDELTVAEVLKDAGYETCMVGKWHLGDQPEFLPTNHGFDEYFGVLHSNDMSPYEYYRGTERLEESIDREQQTKRYTEEALSFIEKPRDAPFFLYLAHTMPHTPLAVSEEFAGKTERGKYGDVVREIDWSVEQILSSIRKQGIENETLVIFTSDNGPWLHRGEHGGLATPLRGGKGSTYEGGVRVPCIAWQPGTVPANTTCHEIATTMDVLPTLTAMADGKLPADRKIDGHDISSLLTSDGNVKTPYEKLYYYFGNELHGVRSGRWKLRTRNHLRNENIYNYGAPKDVFLPAALYDLERDPGEQKNVMKNHPEIVARLRGYLEQARSDLGDSLTDVPPTNTRPSGRIN